MCLEKIIFTQLMKKFSTVCGTLSFKNLLLTTALSLWNLVHTLLNIAYKTTFVDQ
jgi:hypothetical protein